ncbi:MAG: hypothetical protein ACI8Y4_001631 [Candidatus Poriferisodalaceae bacterium]
MWYAAYGSNLLRERFMLYLEGGQFRTQGRPHEGARNNSAPIDDRVLRVDHQMSFGYHSSRWGGGVSFLDPNPGSGEALVRCWSVTREQFADIAAQENGLAVGDIDVDLDRLTAEGSVPLTSGWYGLGLVLGEIDGAPVVTFTAPEPVTPTTPGSPYLEVILNGLTEMGAASDPVSAASYLLGCPGVSPSWAIDALSSLHP